MACVYILRCADDTYYTGWTNDLTVRLTAHNRGRGGAKYTRSRRPVQLVYCEVCPNRSEAMKRETQIKSLTREQKQSLVDTMPDKEPLTIYDTDERVCGTVARALVHQLGLRHHVCHLWLLQEKNGVLGHWIQQRAWDRPLYPGLYDLAATGHMNPDETAAEAVLRECAEEIGVRFAAEQVTEIGTVEQKYARPDGGFDHERVYVFAIRVDQDPAFSIGSEVCRMIWVPLEKFGEVVDGVPCLILEQESIPSQQFCCLHRAEWELLRQYLGYTGEPEEKC